MLRIVATNFGTLHSEQYLCSTRDGNPCFGPTGYGFTILSGQPAHMSKTPYRVTGKTPIEAWQAWYNKAGVPVIVSEENLPGDTALHVAEPALLPALQTDGWVIWIQDSETKAAVLVRSEFVFKCGCWPSRHREQRKHCGNCQIF